jgi:serine-type D-Ala-D-Ala carboxypeptidase/endopeptidase (penicillin-binding protein 4)
MASSWISFKSIFIAVIPLLFAMMALPVLSAAMPDAVRQSLIKAGIPETAIGIYVKDVHGKQPILAVNSDTALNPASVMKLLTTYAGLELLGPTYTWRTEIYALGKVDNGVLHGDLAIKGYGDPNLNLENFWLLVRKIRQMGLHKITGDLILDTSYYNVAVGDPAAFDGDRYKTYNVFPEAVLVNYLTSALYLTPQPENNRVRVVVDPASELLDIQNNLKLTRGNCGDWRNQLLVDVRKQEGNNGRATVILNGNYASQCGQNAYHLSLHESSAYVHDLFRKLWMQQGGSFQGAVRNGVVPRGVSPLRVYQSPSLAEIIRGINKFSNNVAARQLYLALGETAIPPNGMASVSLDQSNGALRRWLFTKRLSFPELVVENGSGLSRIERISAYHMGELLVAAFQSPVMPEFMSSLAIAGLDGTMRNRFRGTLVAGKAHMKTGTLNNVMAIAGYVLDHQGRRIAVVFFVNHPQAGNARSAIDALVRWVYERP